LHDAHEHPFPYLTPDGEACIRRDPDNNRFEDITSRVYSAGIERFGLDIDKRSKAIVRAVPLEECWLLNKEHWHMCRYALAAATTITSVYDAWERCPENENVQLTIQNPLRAQEMCGSAPYDVKKHVIEKMNDFQEGSGFTLEQLWCKYDEMDAAWKAYMTEKDWKTRSFGSGEFSYDSMRWIFFNKTYGEDLKFGSTQHFKQTGTFLSEIRAAGLFDDLRCLLREQLDNRHRGWSLDSFGMNAYTMESCLRGRFEEYNVLPPACKPLVIMAGLRFALPLVDESLSFFALAETSPTKIETLIRAEINFLPRHDAEKADEENAGEDDTATPAVKRRRLTPEEKEERKREQLEHKRVQKRETLLAKSAAKAAEGAEEDRSVRVPFFVAAGMAIEESAWMLAKNKVDIFSLPDAKPLVQKCIAKFWEFGLTGKLRDDPGCTRLGYLRARVYQDVSEFIAIYSKYHNLKLFVEPKLVCCDVRPVTAAPPSSAHAGDHQDMLHLDSEGVVQLLEWVRINPVGSPHKMHPCYRRCATAAFDMVMSDEAADLCPDAFSEFSLKCCCTVVQKEIKTSWHKDLIARAAAGRQCAIGDHLAAEEFLQLRSKYVCSLLDDVLSAKLKGGGGPTDAIAMAAGGPFQIFPPPPPRGPPPPRKHCGEQKRQN